MIIAKKLEQINKKSAILLCREAVIQIGKRRVEKDRKQGIKNVAIKYGF